MPTEVLTTPLTQNNVVPLGTENGIAAAILARPEKTLGKIICKPDSSDLIDGVQIAPLAIRPGHRGFFVELGRLGQGLLQE